MLHGPVMLDLAGVEITADDVARLQHPATGGVILFSRNYESREQLYRLVREIHELRSPPLLIAVDQEGGRVQRFRDGFTRLPPAARILEAAESDLRRARGYARELGWLMAAELRASGVDFSFAPVLDLNFGLSSVIGDRSFGTTADQVTALAQSWMMGAREAGMISVGKHFPGHGGVRADSHLELPVDERSFQVLGQDIEPFRRLIDNGLEAIMPAHVLYPACDAEPAGFSTFWLQQVLRGQLGFQGTIFSDDLDMRGASGVGGYAERADAALQAGCDMILICNNSEGADEVLQHLAGYHNPVAQTRYARLHGRKAPDWPHLQETGRWHKSIALADAISHQPDAQLV